MLASPPLLLPLIDADPQARLAAEPAGEDPRPMTQIQFRLPSNGKLSRRFLMSDSVQVHAWLC